MHAPPKIASLSCGSIAYLELGDPEAPLVLCLHGFPDHAPSFLPIARRLAGAGYRVALPWMRGYAPSTLVGPYHAGRIAADALELAGHLGAARFALVGHDWGAVATYRAALASGEPRLACAVAMSVPHPLAFLQNLLGSPAQARRSWYMFFFQIPGVSERALRHRDLALVRSLWRRWSPGYELPAPSRRELEACLTRSLPAPLEHYRALRRPGAIRDAALFRQRRIHLPLLYLHGDSDGCIAPAAASGQGRWFSGPLESEVIPRAGHFLHLEAPAIVADRVLAWLRRHPP